jgi:hypothetical protein
MSGSARTSWGIFGNSAPQSEVVKQAPEVAVQHAGDRTMLLRKGWSPQNEGAYCKSFVNLTESDIQKICREEPTAVDYIPEFIKRYP